MATWSFEITDINGRPLESEALPTSMRISRVWNGPRMLEATIPLTTDLPALLQLGRQFVTAVRHEASGNVTRFHGILWTRTFSFRTVNPVVTITAVDPWSLLNKRFTAQDFAATDQGQIVRQLIIAENAIANTRIATTLVPPATKLRDRSWAEQPRPVSEAVQSFTSILDPIDIDLRPKEFNAADGTIVDLVISERVVSPASVFTLGWGEFTTENLVSVEDTMTMEDVGNYIEGQGEEGTSSLATDPTSIAKYGRHTRQETFSGVSEQSTLDDHTDEVVAKYSEPLPIVRVEPRRGADMMLWDNFDVGNVVDVDARLGNVMSFTSARVLEATVEVDGNGERITDITLQEART